MEKKCFFLFNYHLEFFLFSFNFRNFEFFSVLKSYKNIHGNNFFRLFLKIFCLWEYNFKKGFEFKKEIHIKFLVFNHTVILGKSMDFIRISF